MKRISATVPAAIVAGLAVLAAGCGTSQPSAPTAAARPPAESSSRCEAGTLGLETGPITRQVRKKLALAEDARGAVVTEVFPGGPAAAAGVRVNDVVEKIGPARIGNDCEFVAAANNRSCEPVGVVLRRTGAVVEVKVVPTGQDAFFEESCGNGVRSGCFRQAWALSSRNRERALALYETVCRAGSAEACAYEGLQLMDAANRGKDALAALERSCDLGSGGGCATLAFLYATGKHVRKDDRRATPLYNKACDLGDAQGCYNAGLMADDGRGEARSLSRAAARYDEGCALGSATACTNLGFLYENGRGVAKDPARANALYRRGCEGASCQPANLNGCVNVGRGYRDGIGVEKNAAKAAAVFQDVCNRELDLRDPDAAANRARACSLLGGLYLAGDGVEKDLRRGL
jgi:TPR repeat protein